jgi:hypothetical protein
MERFLRLVSATKIPFARMEASTDRDRGRQKFANRRNFHCVPMATFGRMKLANCRICKQIHFSLGSANNFN